MRAETFGGGRPPLQERISAMLVWQKRASAAWLATNEKELAKAFGDRHAIVETPNHQTALAEIAGDNRRELEKIRARFGGRIRKLTPDWLTRNQIAKPIKVGKRLTIHRSTAKPTTTASLTIPAGAAFGTGEHATTAMSLRLLEQITRNAVGDWTMLDLGAGSGILALAARRFGAKRVVAIDSDPMAISVAQRNARLNRIKGIEFRTGDARRFSSFAKFEIVSANLYSELLIEILPKLKKSRQLILSGILREQEPHFLRTLSRNEIEVNEIRRRGKWIALLCAGARLSGPPCLRIERPKKFDGAKRSPQFPGHSGDFDFTCTTRRLIQGRRSRLCPNFPTPSSRRTRCANRAPAGSCRG